MISAQPENQQRQEMFAEILAARLQQDPDLAKELIDLMGGQEGIQQVIADRNSTIKDVSQDMKGSGKQTVQADNKSRIEGVKQVKQ